MPFRGLLTGRMYRLLGTNVHGREHEHFGIPRTVKYVPCSSVHVCELPVTRQNPSPVYPPLTYPDVRSQGT